MKFIQLTILNIYTQILNYEIYIIANIQAFRI